MILCSSCLQLKITILNQFVHRVLPGAIVNATLLHLLGGLLLDAFLVIRIPGRRCFPSFCPALITQMQGLLVHHTTKR